MSDEVKLRKPCKDDDANNAFVTGSRAYGKPAFSSDVDLVVRVSEPDAAILRKTCEALEDTMLDRPGWYSLRFGKLNLILCDETRYDLWRSATTELVARKPVSREQAVECVKTHLAKIGERDAEG